MADNAFSAIGDTGGSSGRGSVSVGGTQVISPLAIPELLKLFQRAQGAVPTQQPGIRDIVTQGMQSPLLQAVLGPALERLRAPQQLQQQQLTEATRAAGGLRGSTYSQGMNTLMQNQAQSQNDLMAQVIQQMLAPLITGQLTAQRQEFMPAEAFTNLLRAAAPSSGRGGATASTGWESIPPSLGLGTEMQSGNLASTGPGGGIYASPRMPSGGAGPYPNAPAPSAPPPQYVDPWLSGGGQLGGGSYDIGGGIGYLPSPAVPTGPPMQFLPGTDMTAAEYNASAAANQGYGMQDNTWEGWY